jgi:hypothetical protein
MMISGYERIADKKTEIKTLPHIARWQGGRMWVVEAFMSL